MKIVHVVDSMEIGGAETLVAQMCRLQRETGHEPIICALSKLGDIGRQMLAEGFTVYTHLGENLPAGVFNLYRKFRELRPSVVHAHNPTPTIYGALPARMAGVKSVLSTRHSLVSPPHNPMVERKYAFAARSCDWIVGICDATTENVRRIGKIPSAKILRVYNGAAPLSPTQSERTKVNTAFTVLFVGRLQPVKNLGLLLDAFRLVLNSAPEMRLWIVGDGIERESLQQKSCELGIDANVTFWGQQMDVSTYFSSADLFVMSSTSEGLPVSLLQSFSIGLPAVVTDVGGMSEVVRNSGGGLVVPSQDASSMAQAILKLAQDRDERLRLSANARAAFNAKFSLEIMVRNYMELYCRQLTS